jgi:F-type H+-transporting ATPase subunit alpha
MEAFSKFGGDMDASTRQTIDKGARNVEILKQAQFAPYSVDKQVAIIYLGTNNLLREVPVKNIKAFEDAFMMEMENKMPELLAEFKKGNLPEEGLSKMVSIAQGLIPQFK